jgi:hypothetical protein
VRKTQEEFVKGEFMNGFLDGEVVNLEMGDGSEHELLKALFAYTQGVPAVIFSSAEHRIHGAETLQGTIASNVGLNVCTIYGIYEENFFASDWPELLEAARHNWLKGGKFGEGFIQFLQDRIERTNGLRGLFCQGGAQ